MDIAFDVAQWRPTRPPYTDETAVSEEQLAALSHALSFQTKEILRHPYNPEKWIERAKTLKQLRYPELTLGDAHKAIALCATHREILDDHREWRLGHCMGFWIKDDAPLEEDAREVLHCRLTGLQSRAEKFANRVCSLPNLKEGRFVSRPYPWLSTVHRKRSDELLDLVNQEFAQNLACEPDGLPCCMVRRHAFGKGAADRGTSNVLGAFAICDIRKGETILIDETRIWSCIGPEKHGDRANLYGGPGCSDPLHPNQPKDDSNLDIRWIRDRAGRSAADVIVRCRFLLCSIQDGESHPLDHSLIARLIPTYRNNSTHREIFALEDDIAIPNKALQQFGIDIFANHNYDTWILFTIAARVANNSCGSPIAECLNPLFSLFNHSCEPNVEWSTSGDHRTILVKAGMDIKAGEQLFVQYNNFVSEEPLEVRRKAMERWLDGPCQCTRCVREEREQKAARADGSVGVEGTAKWDVMEKAVFPEDLLKFKK